MMTNDYLLRSTEKTKGGDTRHKTQSPLELQKCIFIRGNNMKMNRIWIVASWLLTLFIAGFNKSLEESIGWNSL